MSNKKKKLPNNRSRIVRNFSPRTDKQHELVELIKTKEVVIARGVAGSGKTYATLATALNLLGDVYEQVVLVKSVTTLPGEEIGFLKGGMEQKMEPFLMSYTWNIDKLCGNGASDTLMENGFIKILPLAFVRGLSIDNSIVIIDEAQNLDYHTFKTIITRIGENSKYVLLGDTEQIDRRHTSESCLSTIIDIFSNSDIIGIVEFHDSDCVRNPIIPKILSILRDNNI